MPVPFGNPGPLPWAGRQPRGFRSRAGTVGNWQTEAPDAHDDSRDNGGYFPVSRLHDQYLGYLGAKIQEYEEQKLSRHYYHGAQYTPRKSRSSASVASR
jgi:hypothetical protein